MWICVTAARIFDEIGFVPLLEARIGTVAPDGDIVDLNAAYTLYLRNVEQEGAFYALADAPISVDMGGCSKMEIADSMLRTVRSNMQDLAPDQQLILVASTILTEVCTLLSWKYSLFSIQAWPEPQNPADWVR